MVCGKRHFLDDPESPNSRVYKRFRYNSTVQFNLKHLVTLFPHLEIQFLEKALEDSGNDVDVAIKTLQELQHAYAERNSEFTAEQTANVDNGEKPAGVEQVQNNLPVQGSESEWIELLVRGIHTAASEEDARSRTREILGILEKSIRSHVIADATQSYNKEKEQNALVFRENGILKRGVAIQQKHLEEKNQEMQQLVAQYEEKKNQELQQLVAQYEEKIRIQEKSIYALSVHLRQFQQNNNIRFNPDVY